MVEQYDKCPDCQEPLDDVEAAVRVVLFGSVVNGKLTGEVADEEMAASRCGKCGHVLEVKEWDYKSEGKEKHSGL